MHKSEENDKRGEDWKGLKTWDDFDDIQGIQPSTASHTQATGEKFICKSLEPIFCGNEQLNHISCGK